MRKFLIKIIIYAVLLSLFLVCCLISSTYIVSKRNFKNSQTESNTLIIKENEKFDLLLLGISHARNFSRYGNHEKVEKILQKKIINIGQGSGFCSINEQFFYLDYFYSEGNRTDEVCIVLTPPMLSSETLPIASNTFENEIFDAKFLYNYMLFESENKNERITNYLQSKFSKSWLNLKPDLTQGNFDSLVNIDIAKVKEGFKLAYGETLNFEQFEKSCLQVEKIIQLAQKNNSKVTLFIPPALFGKWQEHNETITFLQKIKKKYNCRWMDFSESISFPYYYYDHHHLNTNGVVYFTEYYLKQLITE